MPARKPPRGKPSKANPTAPSDVRHPRPKPRANAVGGIPRGRAPPARPPAPSTAVQQRFQERLPFKESIPMARQAGSGYAGLAGAHQRASSLGSYATYDRAGRSSSAGSARGSDMGGSYRSAQSGSIKSKTDQRPTMVAPVPKGVGRAPPRAQRRAAARTAKKGKKK